MWVIEVQGTDGVWHRFTDETYPTSDAAFNALDATRVEGWPYRVAVFPRKPDCDCVTGVALTEAERRECRLFGAD